MKEIDACGLDCPKPVIKTKDALIEVDELKVIVDNQVAADNVARFAKNSGYKVSKLSNETEYIIQIEAETSTEDKIDNTQEGKVFFITSQTLGEGEEELGETLIRGFLTTLLKTEPLPAKIIFINSGVKIPTTNEKAKNSLAKLDSKGVDILSCGACLDYYDLEDKLEVGKISNMYEIVESLNNYEVVKV